MEQLQLPETKVKDNDIIGFGEVCPDSFHPSTNIFRDDGVIEVYPVDSSGVERKWRYARQSVEKIEDLLKVNITNEGVIQIRKAKNQAQFKTVWDDPLYIAGDYGTRLLTDMGIFPEEDLFPKSIHTVSDSIYATSEDDSIIFDFFAGSGTTAHAVMNLNRANGGRRKYILVEMGEHFETVILPRVKKVAFCSKWKEGKPVFDKGEGGLSHFVKVYELEQYEDVLRRARYADADLFDNPYEDAYHRYIFLRDLKLLEGLEVDPDRNAVRFHPERLYEDVDLAETLSNLLGKWIRRVTPDFVEFEDGERFSLADPDWRVFKPLIWWE